MTFINLQIVGYFRDLSLNEVKAIVCRVVTYRMEIMNFVDFVSGFVKNNPINILITDINIQTSIHIQEY